MKNHKIFKKYKDALSYANDLIDGIKGEVLFDDAWDDYLINGENTGDCKLYKNGKFIKTITIDDNYKWSNLIMLYKKDDGFMVYTDFEFDESKKSARKSIKESDDDINNTAYFNRVAGELHSWYVCYVEDYKRKYEYGFKNEKECMNWIKKNGFDLDPSMIESKTSSKKSMKESKNDIDFNNLNGFVNFKEYGDSSRGGGAFSEIKKLFEKDSSFQYIVSLIKDLESDFELTKFTFSPNGEINISFKEVGGNFEFFVKYEIIRSGIGLTNLRYF